MESKANGGGTENAKTLWIKRLRTNRVFLHHGVNAKKISLSHSVDEDECRLDIPYSGSNPLWAFWCFLWRQRRRHGASNLLHQFRIRSVPITACLAWGKRPDQSQKPTDEGDHVDKKPPTVPVEIMEATNVNGEIGDQAENPIKQKRQSVGSHSYIEGIE